MEVLVLAEDLGLRPLELLVGQHAAVAQIGEAVQVVSGAVRAAPAGEPTERLILGAVLNLVFVQRVPAHEQVAEHAEQREDEDEEHPQGLGPV